MTAKEWLNRGYKAEKEIQTLLAEKAEALAKVTGATAEYSVERVQTSRGDVQEKKLMNYVAYNEIIAARIDELYTIKGEILNAVNAVDNAVLRQLLILRYVRFMTWDEIAVEMGYSLRAVYILHGKALKKAGEFIPPPNKT